MLRTKASCIRSIAIAVCFLNLFLVAMSQDQYTLLVSGSSGVGNIVVGPASIVMERKDLNKVRKGDIVVAHAIESSWDKGLHDCAGIITEIAGNNNHALSFGKKWGIPVVIGATGATKKISEGSFITLDSPKKKVYSMMQHNNMHAANNNYSLQQLADNNKQKLHLIKYEPSHISFAMDAGFSAPALSSESKESKEIIIQDFKNKLHQDAVKIKKYVTETVAGDIHLAEKVGKWAATWKVTAYAYDSIPFEFFKNERALEEVFARLDEGADYIRTLKDDFKTNILKNKKTIDNSEIAEFLYKNVVDRITVDDDIRQILKKEPVKMDEFVRGGTVSREEYMYFTLLNFATRYYLEKELKKK